MGNIVGKTSGVENKLYFSDKLKQQLKEIPHHPVTFVSAPSGFGKTTAVKKYLEEYLPHGACEFWYTCLGESAAASWFGICELFSNIDGKVSEDLRNLDLPTIDTLFYLITYLRGACCQTETYLVIDNYQMMKLDIPYELISAFSMHGSPKLHIIFITQQLAAEQQLLTHNDNIYTIGAGAFFFNRDDTARLFRLEGLRIAEDELNAIYASTGGWVSAICLQIINYKQTGAFNLTNDISTLVEKAIWKNLTQEEKEFLLAVGVLDSFTIRQAANSIGKEVLPECLEYLIKSSDFIRYLPDKQRYSMHSILQEYLRGRVQNYLTEEHQIRIYKSAGRAMAADQQYYPAIKFFYRIKDYEAMLALPVDQEYTDMIKENYQTDLIDSLVNGCPEEILCRYPVAILRLAYLARIFERVEAFEKLFQLLYRIIQEGGESPEKEIREIHGEYMLLNSVAAFNDFQQMKSLQEKAWKLLRKPSIIFKHDTPWIFGTISAVDIFWSKPGELENDLRCMDEMMPVYLQLTRFNGAGADYLFRAEALLMRGEDEEAEILCYKALYKAGNHKQTSICICAELVLARIAILRGDGESYRATIKNIQNYGKENSRLYILRMVEQGLSSLSLLLGLKDDVIPWLYDMESIKRAVYPPVIPQAMVLYLRLLQLDKRYTEFYGASQYILEDEGTVGVEPGYLMPRIYVLLFFAMAKLNTGNNLEAVEYLKQALELALPDRVYLPFAQVYQSLCPIFELAKLSCWDVEGLNKVIFLGKRQVKGVQAIRKSMIACKSPLTPREREVALLIKSRLTAKEVAEKLYISDATVRTILRNVYSKLDVHSKSELMAKEF